MSPFPLSWDSPPPTTKNMGLKFQRYTQDKKFPLEVCPFLNGDGGGVGGEGGGWGVDGRLRGGQEERGEGKL